MIIRRGYRFKLKPTPEVEHAFVVMAGHARFAWNKALRLNLDRLVHGVPIIRYTDLCGLLHLWKQSNEYGFLAEAHSQVLQQKLRDLDRAFADAFDPSQPQKRLPRFKRRGCGDSANLGRPAREARNGAGRNGTVRPPDLGGRRAPRREAPRARSAAGGSAGAGPAGRRDGGSIRLPRFDGHGHDRMTTLKSTGI